MIYFKGVGFHDFFLIWKYIIFFTENFIVRPSHKVWFCLEGIEAKALDFIGSVTSPRLTSLTFVYGFSKMHLRHLDHTQISIMADF